MIKIVFVDKQCFKDVDEYCLVMWDKNWNLKFGCKWIIICLVQKIFI